MFQPYPDDKKVRLPQYHPIIEYLATLWDTTDKKEELFNNINFTTIAAMCTEKTFPKGYEQLSTPDLTSFINDRIPQEQRWWLQQAALGVADVDDDAGTSGKSIRCFVLLTSSYHATDMADPDVVEDIPDPSGAHEDSSSDETGDNDDEYMDDSDPKPRQSARKSAKRPIVTSPPGQPPPQHPKVDYSVCH